MIRFTITSWYYFVIAFGQFECRQGNDFGVYYIHHNTLYTSSNLVLTSSYEGITDFAVLGKEKICLAVRKTSSTITGDSLIILNKGAEVRRLPIYIPIEKGLWPSPERDLLCFISLKNGTMQIGVYDSRTDSILFKRTDRTVIDCHWINDSSLIFVSGDFASKVMLFDINSTDTNLLWIDSLILHCRYSRELNSLVYCNSSGEVFQLNLADKSKRRVLKIMAPSYDFILSADGKKLLFSSSNFPVGSESNTKSDLFVFDLETLETKKLTDGSANNFGITIMPGQKDVVFYLAAQDNESTIMEVNLINGNKRHLGSIHKSSLYDLQKLP